jgi:phosphopantetheinyl transferase
VHAKTVAVISCATSVISVPILSGLEATLSAEERERAAKFVHDEDRHSYIAAHALLRHALSIEAISAGVDVQG